MKRMLCMLLALAMVVGMLPTQAFAAETLLGALGALEELTIEEPVSPPENPTIMAETEPTQSATEETEPTQTDPIQTETEADFLPQTPGTIVASGECGAEGDNVTWLLTEDGTMTISGTGDMKDYSYDYYGYDAIPWHMMRESIRNVVVEPGVTSLGDWSFYLCNRLTSISIPDSVETLGRFCFYSCSSLTDMDIPDSVTILGDSCFQYCTGLTEITIPGSVTTLGDGCFTNCTNLTSISIPDSVTTLGQYCFSNCHSLTGIHIPDSVTLLGDACFSGCTSLTSIIIPDYITRLGNSFFSGCTSLTSVTLPENLHILGNSCFYNCSSLTSITIPDNVTTLEAYCFYGCKELNRVTISKNITVLEDSCFSGCTDLTSITIPDGVIRLEDRCFSYSGLTGITLPDSITDLGDSCFMQCLNLSTITLPNSVISLGDYCFFGCKSLTNISIPSSVTSLGDFSFLFCSNLTDITFQGDAPIFERIPHASEAYTFSLVTATAHYPAGNATWTADVMQNYGGTITWESYGEAEHIHSFDEETHQCECGAYGGECGAEGDNVTWLLTEDGTMTLSGAGATKDMSPFSLEKPWSTCSDLIKKVVIEEGITELGVGNFTKCANLAEITFPESLTQIGSYCFNKCSSLPSVVIPGGVTELAYSVFSGCQKLTSVTLSEGLRIIGNNCFGGCSSVTEIKLPESLTEIISYCFSSCTALPSIAIPKNVSVLEENVFSYCSNLEEIQVDTENQNYSSHEGVLYNRKGTILMLCPPAKVGSYVIPRKVTTLYGGSFSECANLNSVRFAGKAPDIWDYAFWNTTLTAQYPANDPTWTTDIMLNYGGKLTWEPYDPHIHSFDENHRCECGMIGGECGAQGDNLLWELTEDGELIISGAGEMADYVRAGAPAEGKVCAPWSMYSDAVTVVIVEKGATSLGDFCFANCEEIASVQLPDGIKDLGYGSFWHCYSLTGISIPEGITTLKQACFLFCTSLTQVILPDSLTTLEAVCFNGCRSLRQIDIPEHMRRIDMSCFQQCTELKHIRFQGDAPVIGENAFGNVVTDVYYPADNDTWTSNVRQNYGGKLNWITHTHVYDDAHKCECGAIGGPCGDSLVWRLLQDGTLVISGTGDMWDYTYDALPPWNMYCEDITALDLRQGITKLGTYAFSNCAKLTSITIPEGVTQYGACCFEYCEKLEEITIPTTLTSAGRWSFFGCLNIRKVFISDLEAWCGITFEFADKTWYSSNPLYAGARLYINGTLTTEIEIPDTVTELCDGTFAGYRNLTKVTIPDSVTKIGNGCFVYCGGLTSISIPDSVTSLGNRSFASCDGLTSVIIPDSVKTMDDYCFAGCSNLAEVTLSKKITKLNDCCFEGCASLTSIMIPDAVEEIGGGCFSDCEKLEQIVLPETVSTIGSMAFSGCGSLTSITFPAGVKTLGEWAFIGCESLTSITFKGNAPVFEMSPYSSEAHTFSTVTATAYYPANNSTWTEDKRQNYGGEITWVAVEEEEDVQSDVIRISGKDRCLTARLVAEQMRSYMLKNDPDKLDGDKFRAVILASGSSFADALAGSYLSNYLDAPILLHRGNDSIQDNLDYLDQHLSDYGIVYILGGSAAVPLELEAAMDSRNIDHTRLSGKDRFHTNLKILNAADFSGGGTVLVCTGYDYADSLSASSTGLPIFLVNNGKGDLTAEQYEFLNGLEKKCSFAIIGGANAVSDKLQGILEGYDADGTIGRIKGTTRYETSVAVAKTFCPNAKTAVLAYARNYPDGLCGGSLAYTMGAPLILTMTGQTKAADVYAEAQGITKGYVLGGVGLISDDSARTIFNLPADANIDVIR